MLYAGLRKVISRCDIISCEGLAGAMPRVLKPGLATGHLSC